MAAAAAVDEPEVDATAVWTQATRAHLERLRADPRGVRALRAPPAAGVMLILEPREHPQLEFVIRNFAHHLAPRGWGLEVAHSPGNAAWLRALFRSFGGSGTVRMRELPFADFAPPVYNQILTNLEFWEAVGHENVLVFQTDTYLLDPSQLDEFLEYDYVGAPWTLVCPRTHLAMDHPRSYPNRSGPALHELWPNLVGNGGLSFRKRSAMIEVLKHYRIAIPLAITHGTEVLMCDGIAQDQEDVFFSVALTRLGKRVAPREVAMRFSAETVVPPTLTGPLFGLHRVYSYLPAGVVKALVGLAT